MTPVVSDRGNGTATSQLANDGRTWYQQVEYYTALLEGTAATVPSYTSVVEELALSTLLGRARREGRARRSRSQEQRACCSSAWQDWALSVAAARDASGEGS